MKSIISNGMHSEITKANIKSIVHPLLCILVILICVLPMGLNPMWNGEIPGHRNQYEEMAEVLSRGEIALDLPVDEKLLALDNPYDPDARIDAQVMYFWDHAFYNGHYYMYFGIVPAVLVFLPYRLITGHALTTYHATQLFVALFIAGLFLLFWKFYKAKFKKCPYTIVALLSVSFSLMSVWYSIGAPALYCTAISSGICTGIWSLLFYFLALKHQDSILKRRSFLLIGALLGALAFGCRPPIGLFNVIIIPLLIKLYQSKETTKQYVIDFFCVVFPYILIGSLLMLYNYVRFDSFFEFGQSYQLTIADQRTLSGNNENLGNLFDLIFCFLFAPGNLSEAEFNGVFLNYPILLFSVFALLSKKARGKLRSTGAFPFLATIAVAVLLIAVFDTLWSPVILERYRMDAYWICGIASFYLLCAWSSAEDSRLLNIVIGILGVSTIWLTVLYLFIPWDYNLGALYPNWSDRIQTLLSFGLLK